MANLTSYNNIEDFYLLQELYENNDPITINDKQFNINTIEDLFDLTFARNFEENLFIFMINIENLVHRLKMQFYF